MRTTDVINGRATWAIEQGDCIDGLRVTPNECVHLFVTDPPYGIDYQSARRTDRDQWKPKIANDESPFIWWLSDAFRVCVDGGALLCFCRCKTYYSTGGKWHLPKPWHIQRAWYEGHFESLCGRTFYSLEARNREASPPESDICRRCEPEPKQP